MASINKLSVRGVRAFSPDDEEQVITFAFPLTIIVGANGCGKTTIIEALKYAVTGSLPPGNKSGQAFCHDPKSCGNSVVKAAVKLRFTNRAGKSMVVVRSMELTQKKTTMTFKNLDGIIRTTDEEGNRQSLSHKCTELDRQIPQLLGVSKAILEHVVFCHQEDSSWPLMEGAVLKKRFDDIFDSTRYVKALEELKDQKKKYVAKVKDHKTELAKLEAHKHAAVGLRMDLDTCRQGLSDISDEVEEYNKLIAIEQEKARECNKIIEKDIDVHDAIEEKKNLMSQEEARAETLRASLSEDLSHKSKEDLEGMVSGFEQNVDTDRENLAAIEKEINQIENNIRHLQNKEKERMGERGSLLAEKKIYEENCVKRLELMEELATKYGLDLSISQSQQVDLMSTQINRFGDDSTIGDSTLGSSVSVTITSEDIAAFEESIRRKKKEIEEQLMSYRDASRIGEDEIQARLSEVYGKIKSIEIDISRIKAEEKKARDELKAMPSMVLSSSTRKSDIDEAKDKVKRFTRKRDELSNDPILTDCPRLIREKEDEILKLKGEIEDHDRILKQLRQWAEDHNAIDILKKQIVAEKELIDEVKKENSFLLQKFGISISTNTDEKMLASQISDSIIEIKDKLDSARIEFDESTERLKTSENRVSELKAILSHNKNSANNKNNQLALLAGDGRGVQKVKNAISSIRQYENRFFGNSEISLNAEPQNVLQHCTNKIGELSAASDDPDTMIRTIDKLIELGVQKDVRGEINGIICPCCARDLDDDQMEVYSNRMNELRNKETSPLVKQDQSRAAQNLQAQKNYENWRNLVSSGMNDWLDNKRITLELESLKEVISRDEGELKIEEEKLKEAKEKLLSEKEDVTELQQMLEVLKHLKTDSEKLVTKRRQIDSKQDELALMAPSSEGKDLRSVEREHREKTERKDMLGGEISSINKKLSELNKEIQTVSQQVTQAEKMARDKEERYAQEQKDNVRRQELTETLKTNGALILKLEAQIEPLRQSAKEKETERHRYRLNSQAEEEKRGKLLSEFNAAFDRYANIHHQVCSFTGSEKLDRLVAIETEIKDIDFEMNNQRSKVLELHPALESAKKHLNERESVQKNIERNIELKAILERIQDLNNEISVLMDKLESIDCEAVRKNLNKSMELIKKYEYEKSRRDGSKDTLMIQQRELKRKLQTNEYKDIDERHRVKMIEVETCDMAVHDLDIYYSALDKSLLRYHGLKIAEINKIVKELWSLTYKGEDITSIRLTSDQDQSSKATRSYNYRVVMTKGTTELDMRGRCSAGQRVLASLVIRLALAETFCINCGVMALDEPTTNLDYANKRGLAAALAQIIAHRASQNNFQLVTITHDEEFVSMMKNELATHTGFAMPERYFQVSREESSDGKYYSKIHAIDWDEI